MASSKLTIDGKGGIATIKAAQRVFGTVEDGIISGQLVVYKKRHSAFSSIKYGVKGSSLVKKMQKKVNITPNGQLGPKTIKAWQNFLGVTADGYWGTNTMKAFQKWINKMLDKEIKSVYKVIDVSVWQGTIDWERVKASGIEGVIVRYADGYILDSKFEQNIKGAQKVGLHVGAYIFSRAKTKSAAEAEAVRLYNACKKYKLDMPLYIDLEWATAAKYANTVAKAFINKMVALGGKPGIYANLTWFNNYITAKNFISYPLWIAQYNSKITHSHPEWFGMWQYSSSGSVKGISGKVDMNYCYVAYWNK